MPDYMGSSRLDISEGTLSLSLENRHERPDTCATLSFGVYLAKCQPKTPEIKPNPASHYVTPARELSN